MANVLPERLARALAAIGSAHPESLVATPAEAWEVAREAETWVYVNDRPFASLAEGEPFVTYVVVFTPAGASGEPRGVKAFRSRKGADTEETLP